jgi:DNA-binding XRE family transcriptional regulator
LIPPVWNPKSKYWNPVVSIIHEVILFVNNGFHKGTLQVPVWRYNRVDMEQLDADVATWLNEEAQSRGWSFREIARRIGVSHTTIIKVVNEQMRPSAELCISLAKLFRTAPENVLRLAGYLPPQPEKSINTVEANHLFSQLSEDEQEVLLTQMRALVEKHDTRSLAST